jgi:large conductance mechanosensitive channel
MSERQRLLHHERSLIHRSRSVWSDFKKFIERGSVTDLAIGVVVGNAFTAIVDSFVGDIITPIISLAAVSQLLNESFLVLRKGPNFPYKTREEAKADGAVTWNYGNFIAVSINFMIMAAFMFVIMKMYQRFRDRRERSRQEEEPPAQTEPTIRCRFCKKDVAVDASRCPWCTSQFDE